jgi:hypothetical protein
MSRQTMSLSHQGIRSSEFAAITVCWRAGKMSQSHIVAPHGVGRSSSRHNAPRIIANGGVRAVPGNCLSQVSARQRWRQTSEKTGRKMTGWPASRLNTISDFLNPDAGNRVPSATGAFEPAQSLPFCRRNIRSERALPPRAVKKHCAVRRHHHLPELRAVFIGGCGCQFLWREFYFMERIAVFKTDLLFDACSRCSAWPMSANVAESKWGNQKISFKCSRCGHQETRVTKIHSRGSGESASASKRDLPR